MQGEKDSEADCYCVHVFILPDGFKSVVGYYCKCC